MTVAPRESTLPGLGNSSLTLSRALPALLTLTLVLTGASGLIYQVIWFRILGLTFGVTVQATSAVLAAFMGGLALGSLLTARLGNRIGNPLRAYAIAEIVIGLSGFASLGAFDALQPLYRWLAMNVTDSLPVLTTARFGLAFAIMLVPTTLMGATLPLVVSATVTRSTFAAKHIGMLYAGNTAGAIAGAFFAGFYLIGIFGLTVTTGVAAAFNLVAGAIWLLLSGSTTSVASAESTESTAQSLADEPAVSKRLATTVIVAYAVSGFIALAYEVVWTRVLAGIFPGNVYAFTLMLCAILFGIAAGSWLVTPLLGRRWNWPVVFAALEGLLALFGLLSIVVLANAYSIERALRGLLGQQDQVLLGEPWFMGLFGLLAIGPAALVMGALFPVAVRIVGAGHADGGRRIGLVYGGNVLGAIAGSLATGLLLIPWLGAQRALWLLAAGNLLAGAAVLAIVPVRPARRVAAGLAAALIAAAAIWVTPDLYRTLFATIPWNERTIWYDEGQDATVRVSSYYADNARVLYINSEHQGTDQGSGLYFHYRLGHLGPLLHPAPRDVLVIGMGVGATPGAAAVHNGSQVHVVELYPGVVEAARLFQHANYDVHNRPNVSVEVNDGRNFLLLTRRKFDVIEADPILPTNAGAANLYSADYYKLARTALKDDGLMVQWLNNTLPGNAYRMMLRAFLDAFPYATLWEDGSILVGSPQPIAIDPDVIARKFDDPELRAALATIGYTNANDILREYTAGPDELWAYAGDGPRITDRFPAIEYIRTVPFEGPGATPAWFRVARHFDARREGQVGIVYGEGSVRERLHEYYRGALPELVLPASIEGRERETEESIRRFAEGKDQIWFLPWWQSEGDVLAEATLNGSAYLVDDQLLGGVRLLRYSGGGAPALRPADTSFGGTVRLTGIGVDRGTARPGEVARIALGLEALHDIDENVKLSLRLTSPDGRVLATIDRLPHNAPTDEWRRGQRIIDRIGLLVPPGTPPGTYRLDLSLYREESGQPLPAAGGDAAGRLTLGTFEVVSSDLPTLTAAVEAATPLIVRYGPTQLAGYTLDPAARRPGDHVPVALFWQGVEPAARPALTVLAGDPSAPLATERAGPGSARPAGVVERVDLDLRVPATAPPGRAPIWLMVDLPGASPLRLGSIEVKPWPTLPVPSAPVTHLGVRFGDLAVLDGMTIRPTGDGLRVDLVWSPAREIDRSYLVFVHALDADGRIVAQSDQIPAGGQAPTTAWLPGRPVGDSHRIAVAPPPGGRLAIGLYDLITGARVAAGGGDALVVIP
ncbi:MAG: fused MFS/spermidine synthase [Dehalococcoidia bacterium]